jgi:hypothetical protein
MRPMVSNIVSDTDLRLARRTTAVKPAGLSAELGWLAFAIVLISVIYNAILAMIVARGINIGFAGVGALEALITLSAIALSLSRGISIRDVGPISLVLVITIIAVIASIGYDKLYVGSIRNFLIIFAFCTLGQRSSADTIRRLFLTVSLITLVVLIWEISSVETYATVFSPAHYFEVTRGVSVSEFDDSGLSIGTISYTGRFSLGLFSGRRTSSIFLEQVSINAYSIVCMVFLSSFWNKLSWKERAIQLATIILIVTSNNARMGALMCIFMPVGYFVFPYISRIFVPILALCIIGSIFALSPYIADAVGDDLTGRLGVTYRLLNQFSISELLLGSPVKVDRMFDSGYAFIAASVGLFGGLAYLAYLTLYPGFGNDAQRRGSWSAAVYILAWLTIGGTATFSIKTASLLWMLVGHLSVAPDLDEPEGTE